MENKLFCSNCGSEHYVGNAYCPSCGTALAKPDSFLYTHVHQSHCTACGTKTESRGTYCVRCGVECVEYVAASGVTSRIKDVLGDIKLPDGPSDMKSFSKSVTDTVGGAFSRLPGLHQVKERSVWAPALLFAGVAVAVGLVLSFALNLLLANVTNELLDELMYELLGSSPSADLSLGPITIWLLTCLGGLSANFKLISSYGDNVGVNISISLGLIILVIIPAISLFAARLARRAFIQSMHPEKELRAIDGVLGAAMFAIINIIFSFLPSSLGNALNSAAKYSSYIGTFSAKIGALFWNLLLFSFIIAFLFSMPSMKP